MAITSTRIPIVPDTSPPLSVVIVTETFTPEVNGVAVTLASLVRGLAGAGHRVAVVRPRREDAGAALPRGVEQLTVPGAPVLVYPGVRFGFPAARRLRRLWRRTRPDVVYVATQGPLGWSAARAAGALGVPVVSGYHTNFVDFARHYRLGGTVPLINAYLRRFHNRTRATLVPTGELRDALGEAGYRNVEVLRRAVDTTLFDSAKRDPALRRTWGVEADDPVVVWVGRIGWEKNLNLAVRGFEALRREAPSARFVWVGDGPARSRLQRAHPDYIFAGIRHGDELARHYASADVFLFPSLAETYGNVTLEALASGLAVVAYDYGAAREHITRGADGYLVTPGDEERFIGWAAHLGRHAGARRRLQARARRAVARLGPEQVARQFTALLRQYGAGETQ